MPAPTLLLTPHALLSPTPPARPAPAAGVPPCRVTNEGREMRHRRTLQERGLDDDDFIVLDPERPVPRPELGPLERRVSSTFEEALLSEEVDPEAMKYWFTEPEGAGGACGRGGLGLGVGLDVGLGVGLGEAGLRCLWVKSSVAGRRQ